ncbi:LysR family transcriptional regulator [Verticiella sediminum]|nr:LysR family transcriptional regulator [Verticiella sediminum]
MISLKQLEAFYWTARLGGFATAAERLHITQSTLSKRMADLEAQLGAPLFDRTPYRPALTELGRALVEPVGEVLSRCADILQMAGADRPNGRVVFGVTELVAGLWLAPWVTAMRREHPDVVLEPIVDTTAQLTARMRSGELEFVVAPIPLPGPAHTSTRLAEVAFALMARPDHGLDAPLDAERLATLPVLAQSGDSGLTAMFDAWALAQGLVLRHTVASNSLVAISELVLAGVGVAFLPLAYYREHLAAERLVALQGPVPWPRLTYYLITPAGPGSPAAAAMRRVALARSPDALG